MDKIEKTFLLILLIVSAILVLYSQVTSFIDAKDALNQMTSGQAELLEPFEKTLNIALIQIVGFAILFIALILTLIFIKSEEDKKDE